MRPRRTPAALFVLLLALSAIFITRASAETFSNPYHIPTGATPVSVAVGDLNGDGLPDIAWGQNGTTPNLIHVLLAQPNGGYNAAPTLSLPVSVVPYCRLFDANRDHKLDLVCLYENDSSSTIVPAIVVFPSNGDGTFGSPIYTPLPGSGSTYADSLLSQPVDLNGDGIPDLVFVGVQNFRSEVMLGDGNGGFRFASTVVGSIALPFAFDLNGDGKADLVFGDGPKVALGNGDGTFGLIQNYSQNSYYNSICIFADMDGDGHTDAACGYADGYYGNYGATHLIILHGNPDGSFNPTPIADQQFGNHDVGDAGMGTFTEPIAVADLNGDGVLDVISVSNDGYGVLLGGPNLTFSAPKHYVAGSVAGPLFTPGSFAAVLADMNGDSLPDIVATGAGGIYISYGRRDGSFATARAFEVAQALDNAAFADFNGDGNPDVVSTGDTSIQISLGNGDGTFKPFTPVANNGINFSGNYPGADAAIFSGDFNGDHRQDVLALGLPSFSNPLDNDLYVLFGNGDGTFRQPLQVPGSSSFHSPLTDTFIADVNKDGRDDVVTGGVFGAPSAGQAPYIYVSLSNGDGSFNTVTTVAPIEVLNSAFDANILGISLADFDHNGKLDAAIIEQVNAYVLKGHGDGSFDSTGTVLSIPPIPGRTTEATTNIATGDFDGDGNADVALLINISDPSNFLLINGTAVLIYYGKGDGTFTTPVIAAEPGHAYTEMQVADLNGDGLADIVLRNPGQGYEAGAVGILHALPGRTFAPEVNYVASGTFFGSPLKQAAVLDVNRDGLPDLLFTSNIVTNSAANSVAVLLNQPQPEVTGALAASPEPSLFGQSFTLTATLFPPSPGVLAGNVTFSIDGATVGTQGLSGNAATVTVPGTLAIGQHSILAIWPGDTIYQAVAISGTHTVTGLATTTTLTSSLNPSSVGQSVTFTATASSTSSPTGSVTFSDGATVLATQPLTSTGSTTAAATFSTSALAAGSHTIKATYIATGGFAASSAQLTQTVNALPSATALTAAPNPALFGTAVTFTATVTNASTTPGVPTGNVTFYDGAAMLAVVSLDASGHAAFTTSTLAVGSHILTAAYAGSSTYAASVSAPFTETIQPLPQDFTLTLASPTITIRTQHHTTTALTLASLNGFADSLAIACANLPQYVTCQPTPSTAALTANGTTTVSLYLDTDSVLGYARSAPAELPGRRASPIALALLLPFTFAGLALSRRSRRTASHLRLCALLLALLPLSLALTGCGNIILPFDPPPSAVPGTYTIPITATGANTHLAHTANLTLTITP